MSGRYSEILSLQFDQEQARLLSHAAHEVAAVGGPDSPGAAALSLGHAKTLTERLTAQQSAVLHAFTAGTICAIEFKGMEHAHEECPPKSLPSPEQLARDPGIIVLASRNQILLCLVGHRSFAFDIDNNGQHVRLVGNLKGGGLQPLPMERPELSSHSGLPLGPHTEPPYNCSVVSEQGHSPAPSSLILTARWNPDHEITRLVPAREAIKRLNGLEALALSSSSFCFTRSECFIQDESLPQRANSILQYNQRGDSLCVTAPIAIPYTPVRRKRCSVPIARSGRISPNPGITELICKATARC